MKRRSIGGHRWWRRVNLPLAAAALATILVVLGFAAARLDMWTPPGVDDLEHTTVDARLRLRGERAPLSDRIVIVGIDDRTRAEAPQVIQTRRGWASLIEALGRYEPRAIGVDLFFSSPEVTLSREAAEQVRAAYDKVQATPAEERTPLLDEAGAALGAVVEELRGDEILAAAVAAAGRVHLGVLFFLAEAGEEGVPAGVPEPTGLSGARFGEAVAVEAPASHRPPEGTGVIRSLPAIASGAAGAGALNVLTDDDGITRKVYGVVSYGGRYYMPLGLALALRAMGDVDASYVVGQRHIRAGRRTLPAGPRGELMLSYLGRNAFPHVSAADVLSGAAPRDSLTDKLVFVGYTDAARDKIDTPLGAQFPGVEAHATLAHNVLHDELLREADPIWTLVAILALGALVTALQLQWLRRRRAWVPAVAALGLIALYVGLAQLLLAHADLLIGIVWPAGGCLLITLAAMSVALATEGREKAQLRAAFSQYVSDQLVSRIVADPTRARLGGERRELSVLFSDIRGFSRFSEQLEPEELSAYLNEYLTPMTELVMSEGGMLDKYIGDAIMAVYGAPLDMTDHAQHACRSALRMMAGLGPLNERWRASGRPEIAIGIGINSGPMSVGNMGSERRFDYTVVGDAVNLASRLEGLTKIYMVDILAGQRTVELAGGAYVFRELDWVRVKGRDRVASIYQLMGSLAGAGVSAEDLELFARGLAAYRARDWDGADAAFAGFLERHPADGPAHVMRSRLQDLRRHPPGPDWDGVYEQLSK